MVRSASSTSQIIGSWFSKKTSVVPSVEDRGDTPLTDDEHKIAEAEANQVRECMRPGLCLDTESCLSS